MNKASLNFVLLILVLLSCTKDDNITNHGANCVLGEGTIVSGNRTLSNFSSIQNSIYADILVSRGPQEDITVTGQQNILDEVVTTVIGDKLRISHNRCLDIIDAVQIEITIPTLNSLELTGVGDVILVDRFDLPDLEVDLTGVGNIELQGTTTTLDVALMGVGKIRAFELITEECTVTIAGSGDVEVNVSDRLDVVITGVGNVIYQGNPTITSHITGSGRIIASD